MAEVTRELADTVTLVIKSRLAEQGMSHAVAADRAAMAQPTLSRKLRGLGDWTLDELDAVALVLGEPNCDPLIAEARRRL